MSGETCHRPFPPDPPAPPSILGGGEASPLKIKRVTDTVDRLDVRHVSSLDQTCRATNPRHTNNRQLLLSQNLSQIDNNVLRIPLFLKIHIPGLGTTIAQPPFSAFTSSGRDFPFSGKMAPRGINYGRGEEEEVAVLEIPLPL